ncbi:uncharacterized protein I303_102452 [Kwoniella dejecticola CBS 10117]|uniref:BTB domain-containing protein n=1 Tax=Kwoniella dejecticola CBS 10117 TaxID=1296121 RepID=A0A1A6A8S8_9TREE|nr:uncharacterized protein I303_02467 [Kwoniella dejecticola CBS 10117]OBR86460.1 hypothetical protein I303_02467 [Kwoniella dejecticola CBS 10117]
MTPDPQIDEVYQDAEAEYTLVSSDNIAFKVHRHHLFLSSVFKDMVDALDPSCTTISPTDEYMEEADTIRYFLDICHHKATALIWDTYGVFRAVISFVKNYEIHLIEPFLRLQLQKHIEGDGRARYCFILAAELADIECAARSIEKAGEMVFENNDGTNAPKKWFINEQIHDRAKLGPSG